jgi:hypothetical protein
MLYSMYRKRIFLADIKMDNRSSKSVGNRSRSNFSTLGANFAGQTIRRYTRAEDATTMRSDHRWILVLFLSSLTAAAAPQAIAHSASDASDAKPASTATVTGHVYLSDTKGPARRATVYLHAVGPLEADAPPGRGSYSSANDEVESIGVQTLLDGSFSVSGVKAGAYYVIAKYPGYISPYLSLALAKGRSSYGEWRPLGPAQQAAKKAVLETISRITVQAGEKASVDVNLERGAAVSGTVTFDDGSPAAGLEVTLLSRMLRDSEETWSEIQPVSDSPFINIQTDDRGDYRFSGLPAGKYVVRMELNQMKVVTRILPGGGRSSSGSNDDSGYNPISIYSGSTPRLSKAESFTLLLGSERTGEDFRIPLNKLHTITGSVVSAQDGHAVRGGRVELLYADNKSFAGMANMSGDETPGFTFHFIYDGEYLLTAQGVDVDQKLLAQSPGGTSSPSPDNPAIHLYGAAYMPLHVDGDMDNVTISLPEPTATEVQDFRKQFQPHGQQSQTAAQN